MTDLPECKAIAREDQGGVYLEGRPWREVLPPHPAAELFPPLSSDELAELATDIKKTGLLTAVVLSANGKQVIDGRNRLDALALAGLQLFNTDGTPAFLHCRLGPQDDPYEHVVSLNIPRRHLTTAKKRELIAKLMKARPEMSSRQIARAAKVSHHTVEAVRKQTGSNGQIAHKNETERVEASGRKARGRKPGTTVMKPITTVVPPATRPPDSPPGQKYSFTTNTAPTRASSDGLHLFDLAHNDISRIAEVMVAELTLERAEQLVQALTLLLACKRAAIADVGYARQH